MKVIGTAKYKEGETTELLWDDKAKGKRRIMAKTPYGGYYGVTEKFYFTLEEAIKHIPSEFTNWNIFKKVGEK